VIPRTVLIAVGPLGEGLHAARAGAAIGRGLRAGDPTLGIDLCPIESAAAAAQPVAPQGIRKPPQDVREPPKGTRESLEGVRELLEALDFDTRMRAARAVVVGAERLDERTLLGSAVFEIATRARQAGVPAYAVAGKNALSRFDARILDLQVIVEAPNARALRRAGEKLAAVV
jgi:glycerate kinase